MATVYISYKEEDNGIVRQLAPLLEQKGHKIRFDTELFIGSAWRDDLMAAVLSSDAVIVIWTKNTQHSQFVPAEIGMVRATPNIGLLPVVIGKVGIPGFIQDLNVKLVRFLNDDVMRNLARELFRS